MQVFRLSAFLFFFFFKQKTAYEMRISDWSSDVCSPDLLGDLLRGCRQKGPGLLGEQTQFAVRVVIALRRVGAIFRADRHKDRSRPAVEQRAAQLGGDGIVGEGDRKSVVWGQRVSVRGYTGCPRFM